MLSTPVDQKVFVSGDDIKIKRRIVSNRLFSDTNYHYYYNINIKITRSVIKRRFIQIRPHFDKPQDKLYRVMPPIIK